MPTETTTLVCLFHHRERAEAALRDILNAGVPENAITLIGGDGSGIDALDKSELAQLEMPDKDYDHLKQGIGAGGTVVAVQSMFELVDRVEAIFKKHSAEKIDEADADHDYDSLPTAAGSTLDEDEGLLTNPDPTLDEIDVVTTSEPVSEPFKSAGVTYPGAVRLYRFDSVATQPRTTADPNDLDRLP